MRHLSRKGFTLVELLVALVLLSIVSAAIYKVLVSNDRVYTAQMQRMELSQNIRAAATILPADFRTLDASDSDITAMSATSITIRAIRQLAIVCDTPALGGLLAGLTFHVRKDPLYGPRMFAAGSDSLLMYYEGDNGTRFDDGWTPAFLVSYIADNCTDGKPGYKFVVNANMLTGQVNAKGSIPYGAPVLGFETVTYKLYKPVGDTSWYIGYQNASGTQPLIGPVLANGLTLAYYDNTNTVTADRTQVAIIEVRVRARTSQQVRDAGSVLRVPVDSFVMKVSLRNNRRF
jgi:prepilin-type N-terminal cleavage/methylation domain-containing protein